MLTMHNAQTLQRLRSGRKHGEHGEGRKNYRDYVVLCILLLHEELEALDGNGGAAPSDVDGNPGGVVGSHSPARTGDGPGEGG